MNYLKIYYFIFCFFLYPCLASSQTWQLISSIYATTDAYVADVSFKNQNIGKDGLTDVTTILQEHINRIAAQGGGTLFIPEGRYAIRGTLRLKKGVTLRGEWQKPSPQGLTNGTILMAYDGRGTTNGNAFITMEPVTGVMDLSIWYPEQYAESIVPYPTTIQMGSTDVWGNEFCNVKNVTFVNAYEGIVMALPTENACHIISNVYGSPLKTGIHLDLISDVGRIDGVHFSPSYWENSKLPNAPSTHKAVSNYIYSNATGIITRRNDWSYISNVEIEGYKTGLHFAPSIRSAGTMPNGHNYNINISHCNTGLYLEKTENVGIMFAKTQILACNTALSIGQINSGQIQFHGSSFSGNKYAILAHHDSNVRLMMQKCVIEQGQIWWPDGTLMASHCDFKDGNSSITFGPKSKYILTGNTFKNKTVISDQSTLTRIMDDSKIDMPDLPIYTDTLSRVERPKNSNFINAAMPPYLVIKGQNKDNTEPLQRALNDVAALGGGIVFLPPGVYKFDGEIVIPSGVELQGARNIAASPYYLGTILNVYTGKGNETGKPFLRLEKTSGIRGITINYPEQKSTLVPNYIPYPYTLQGAGEGVYIVNVALYGAYQGVDLFTYKCDRHYIDYLTGIALRKVIVVGGNAEYGKISNVQMNPITYVHGNTEKYGFWPHNSMGEKSDEIIDYMQTKIDFIHLGPCSKQTLYNCFTYGTYRGLILDGCSGISVGTGVDGATKALYINKVGSSGFDLINSQLVSIHNKPSGVYVESSRDFKEKVRLFNADFWGWLPHSVIAGSGIIEMHNPVFYQSGNEYFAKMDGGQLSLNNAYCPSQVAFTPFNKENLLSVYSSIMEAKGIEVARTKYWRNNIPFSTNNNEVFTYDKSSWTAEASHNNHIARSAIDGDANTRWDTGKPQSGNEWFKINLGKLLDVNVIQIDYRMSDVDFPRSYEIFVSTDNVNWTKVDAGQGQNGQTTIKFPIRKIQFVRINQIGTDPVLFWSIHEINIYGLASQHIRPNQVILDTGFVFLNTNDTKNLSPLVLPLNLASTTVQWTTDNPAVASVSSSGLVTGLSEGFALISASSPDGMIIATAAFTVATKAISITIEPNALVLTAGSQTPLKALINPMTLKNNKILWSSSNKSIASINEDGAVTAINTGIVTITAMTLDGKTKATATVQVKAGFTVYAYAPPNWQVPLQIFWWQTQPAIPENSWPGIKMDPVVDDNARWYKHRFDDVSFANVIFNDKLMQTSDLTRTKTGWWVNNTWYDEAPWFPERIETESKSLVFAHNNETKKINAKILPVYALDKSLQYSVADASIAIVDQNGWVTSKSKGSTTITVRSYDGQIQEKIGITVDNINNISVEDGAISSINIYPNPSCDYVYIQAKKPLTENIYLAIFNVDGKQIKETERVKMDDLDTKAINISALPAGSYFIKLIGKSGSKNLNFIKH
jgi:uncharacterized protein YjdB